MNPTRLRRIRRSHPRLSAVILVLLAVLLAACGAGATGILSSRDAAGVAPSTGGSGAFRAAGPATDQGSAAQPPQGGKPGAPPSAAALAALADRKIVKTGEITVEVGNVGASIGRVRAMALGLGGYVGGSQGGSLDQRATLTLRIPADRFDDALVQLRSMGGKVLAEATREEDVTSQVVDLQARIENLTASEASYRALLGRATKIDDILSIQTRLDDVRGQIEQLKAQLKGLSGQADLATLTVTLAPQPTAVAGSATTWDPGQTWQQALAALLTVGQAVVTGLIWLGVVWLPLLLVVAFVGAVTVRLLLGMRRRLVVNPPAAPASPADGA